MNLGMKTKRRVKFRDLCCNAPYKYMIYTNPILQDGESNMVIDISSVTLVSAKALFPINFLLLISYLKV